MLTDRSGCRMERRRRRHLIVDLVSQVHPDHERIPAVSRRDDSQGGDPVRGRIISQVPQPLLADTASSNPTGERHMVVHDNHKTICCQSVDNTVHNIQCSDGAKIRTLSCSDARDGTCQHHRIFKDHLNREWNTNTVCSHTGDLTRNVCHSLQLQSSNNEEFLVGSIPIDTFQMNMIPVAVYDTCGVRVQFQSLAMSVIKNKKQPE